MAGHCLRPFFSTPQPPPAPGTTTVTARPTVLLCPAGWGCYQSSPHSQPQPSRGERTRQSPSECAGTQLFMETVEDSGFPLSVMLSPRGIYFTGLGCLFLPTASQLVGALPVLRSTFHPEPTYCPSQSEGHPIFSSGLGHSESSALALLGQNVPVMLGSFRNTCQE